MDEDVLDKASNFEEFSCHKFKDRELLLAALIRPSFLNEHPAISVVMKQEALSNIGDAVIDLLATEHLILIRQMKESGEITDERKEMVKRIQLNKLAGRIKTYLLMSRGEMKVRSQSSIPGECLEAVVGALYLDGGLCVAKSLLIQLGFFEKNR